MLRLEAAPRVRGSTSGPGAAPGAASDDVDMRMVTCSRPTRKREHDSGDARALVRRGGSDGWNRFGSRTWTRFRCGQAASYERTTVPREILRGVRIESPAVDLELVANAHAREAVRKKGSKIRYRAPPRPLPLTRKLAETSGRPHWCAPAAPAEKFRAVETAS